MTRARTQEAIDCFFSNGLWVPGRLLTLFGEVDAERCGKFIAGLHILSATAEPINVLLNSPGGSAIDGMAIFDAISNLANHVTITVLGEATSMGSVILQAADTRLIARNAMMMIHDGTDAIPDLHVRDFERRAEDSKRAREEMYEIFAERTGKTKAYWRRRLGRDCYYTAEQALKEGLVDGIVKRP